MHQCKITAMYNNTILWYNIVPILNKSIVHILTRLKWSVTILGNIKMIKMCSGVRGKVQLTRIYSQCVHTSDLNFFKCVKLLHILSLTFNNRIYRRVWKIHLFDISVIVYSWLYKSFSGLSTLRVYMSILFWFIPNDK